MKTEVDEEVLKVYKNYTEHVGKLNTEAAASLTLAHVINHISNRVDDLRKTVEYGMNEIADAADGGSDGVITP